MDIQYYMKLQNAYKTHNNRERNLSKINRYADRHFDDTFDTQDVLVNNKPMQLMVIKDTDGNVHKKKIKSRHSDVIHVGDYVKWNDQIWLITLLDPDDKTWNKGYMFLCTLLLRWQDESGKIIERFAYAEDYTKYSMGEFSNNYITVGDYQYGITLPVDEYTKKLNRNNRFVIDYEGNYPPDTYRLTGKKIFLNDDSYFKKGGVFVATLSYSHFNKETDELILLSDNVKAWICDFNKLDENSNNPDEETIVPEVSIIGSDKLKVGFERTYTTSFQNDIIQEFLWNIISDFKVITKINNNKIKVLIEDEDLISSSFLLQVIIDNKVVSEKEITIVEGF